MNIATIFSESCVQAYGELSKNKLRTFLSLLGIMIGIFCIISVQATVDSLERNIRESFEKLGDDVVYLDQRPWEEDSPDSYWKYFRRPKPSIRDFEAIKKYSKHTELASFSAFIGSNTVKFQNNSAEGTFLIGTTEDYGKIFSIEMAKGRYFTANEILAGKNSIIIGADVADALFGSLEPINKIINISGQKFNIIGVVAKSGQSLINPINFDECGLLTLKSAQMFINIKGRQVFTSINAKAKPGVNFEEFKDEITYLIRKNRRTKPAEETNFAINELSILDKLFDQFFSVLKIAGLIIGGFSILVGIFSVANIMFVSVKERTNIIGIKKALGATRKIILLEFLIESIILCVLGGLIGLLLVFLVLKLLSTLSAFKMFLTLSNIVNGISLAATVGILAGIIPAFMAARLDPVEAIRK